MDTVIFQTENAEFDFNRKDVKEHLDALASENKGDEATKLSELISTSTDETISIPKEHDYFGHVALDLICAGKGFIACKICNKLKGMGVRPTHFTHPNIHASFGTNRNLA